MTDCLFFLSRSRSPTERNISPKKVAESSKGKEELFWQALLTSNPTNSNSDPSRQGTSRSEQVQDSFRMRSDENPSRPERISGQDPSDSQVDALWKILAKQANLDLEIATTKKKDPKPPPPPSISNPSLSPEVLKPGNYQLVLWDAILWVELETQVTHICQMAATVPEGEDFR